MAALLLLIACINFINLSTAAALKREKATGIRKVLGAARTILLRQFLIESVVYFSLSFALAVVLFIVSFPLLESFTGNELPLSINKQWPVFACTAAFVLVITFLTGLYPAWSLSKPAAVTAFNLSRKASRGGEFFRQSLVTVQFSISIVLLIAALVVHRQFRLLEEAPIGYDKSDLIVADWMEWGNNISAFRNGLANVSGVRAISLARWIPGKGGGSMTSLIKDPVNPDKMVTAAFISGDVSLPKTIGLKLLQGRWLSADYGADVPNFDSLMKQGMDAVDRLSVTQSELVTASAARRLGIKQLGVKVAGLAGIPVGIIADFRNESFKAKEGVCILQAESKGTYGGMLVKVSPGSSKRVKAAFSALFKKYYPTLVLKLDDVSDLLAAQYAEEKKLMQIFYFFSGLIVFLSCMGLFGLVTFMAQSQVKEIGIRKVLGASTERITAMFTWNFLRLVFLSALLALPAGAWLMHRWLQDYPYRTSLSWWLFAMPLFAAAMVATLTVGIQSVRAAMANPADALRSE